jgi:hypothetical protein
MRIHYVSVVYAYYNIILAGYYAAILHNFMIIIFIISAHFINIPKKMTFHLVLNDL